MIDDFFRDRMLRFGVVFINIALIVVWLMVVKGCSCDPVYV